MEGVGLFVEFAGGDRIAFVVLHYLLASVAYDRVLSADFLLNEKVTFLFQKEREIGSY